ncbi:Cuticle protein 7 [Blattella germanica]|nr:Cuticle protein 7 [Blattella germanica]
MCRLTLSSGCGLDAARGRGSLRKRQRVYNTGRRRSTRTLLSLSRLQLSNSIMKFLVIIACTVACALARPDYIVQSPHGFSYSSSSLYPYAYTAPYTYAAYAAHPVVASAPAAVAVAPVSVATAYHAQDTIGQASYGHTDPYQAHHAVQGKVVKTNYVADANGYHIASNALPVGPAVVPAPVVDTPEVAAAKAAHFVEVEKAKARVRRAVVYTRPVAYHTYAHPYHAVYY